MGEPSLRPATHQPALDGVRGLAILLVMVHHLFVIVPVSSPELVAARLAALGAFGVDLFFVLSGFLITGILLDGKGEPRQLVNFYARRTLRIFPLYYLLLAACFLFLPAAMRAVPEAAPKLARFQGASDDWVWYALYLSNYAVAAAGHWRHGVLDVTWSLAIEEQFYILWPWAVLAVSRQTLARVCGAVILVALVSRVGLWAGGYSWLTAYVLTPCRADTLAVGGLLAVCDRSGRLAGLRPAAGWGLAVGLPAVVGAAAVGRFEYHQPWVFTAGYTVIAATAGCGLVWVATAPPGSATRRVFAGRALTVLGKYSYALYLFHLPVRAAIRDMAFGDAQFRRLPGGPWAGQAVFYAIGVASTLPLAVLSWYLIEKRFLALKRYFPNRREA